MLAFFLFLISKEDIKTRQIPDEYSLAIAVLAVGAGGFDFNTLSLAILILILTSLISGMGDAKLFAALTLLFGIHIFKIILLSFLLAAFYSVIGLLIHRLTFKATIAFAPFIFASTMAVSFALYK